MKRFIQGQDGSQSTLFPESLEEYIGDDNTVRVIDAYVDELDLLSIQRVSSFILNLGANILEPSSIDIVFNTRSRPWMIQ